MNAKVTRPIVILATLAFGAALAVFAYTGSFARLWADDYCYDAVLRTDGFWKGQLTFYQLTSDRYSVIPLVGLGRLLGPDTTRFWPLLAIALAVLALAWTLRQAALRFGWHLPAPVRWLLAVSAVFFTFWQAPNLFQVLYWRTGMLTYFMPLVVDIFLAGVVFTLARREQGSPGGYALVFLIAFFAGGFSETTAALQAGALGLALLGTIMVSRLGRNRCRAAQPGLGLVVAALAGTLAAMGALWASPSIRIRMGYMVGPAPLDVLIRDSLRYGFDFIRDTFVTQPLPTLVSILLPAGLGFAGQLTGREPLPFRRRLAALALVLAATYLLIVSVCAPSVYVEVAYPEPRALIAARFALVLGLAAAGWLAGEIAAAGGAALRVPSRVAWLAALGLIVLVSLYPVRAALSLVRQDLPYYQQRAAGWDARDGQIRELIVQGQQSIRIEALDSIFGLTDLQPNADQWPNNCIAGSYGLQGIDGLAP